MSNVFDFSGMASDLLWVMIKVLCFTWVYFFIFLIICISRLFLFVDLAKSLIEVKYYGRLVKVHVFCFVCHPILLDLVIFLTICKLLMHRCSDLKVFHRSW